MRFLRTKTFEMVRNCSLCGVQISVRVEKDKKYKGGHYFGTLSNGWFKKKDEYWECDECYSADDNIL